MTKRHIIVVTLLCCICIPAATQEVISLDVKDPITVLRGGICDFQRIPATESNGLNKTMQRTQETDEVITFRDRITNLPDYLQDFIDQYVEAGQAVLENGTNNWLSDPTQGNYYAGTGTYYYPLNIVTEDVSFTFSNANEIANKALQAAQVRIDQMVDSLKSFLPYAFLAVKFDHPEVFWIGNNYELAVYPEYRPITQYDLFTGEGIVTITITLMFKLREANFDIRVGGSKFLDLRNTSNIAKGVSLYNSSIKDILELCQGKTRYKKLLAVHDWIIKNNCYNYYYSLKMGRDVTGDLPWSPLSALKGTGTSYNEAPVCEGYARAMKVICDKMDIPCILMSGYAMASPQSAPDGHMWTYVKMEDSKWYAIDPTYDDPIVPSQPFALVSGYESHKWFLVGSNDESEPGWPFYISHPEHWAYMYPNGGNCGWLLQEGPELSTNSWTPYDPNWDGVTDLEDIQLMVDKIVNNEDDIDDIDGNNRISVGDLVRLINRSLSE